MPRLITLILLLIPALALGETYIYEESDGTRWITDRPMHGDQWKLIDKYGRPTATRSCSGMTPGRLEQRADKYLGIIERHAEQHRLDPLLVKAVIRVESCFDRRAISRAGARGLMQLMPGTAQQLGVLDSFNANLNIEAGTRYLSKLKKDFKGDLKLALAAYNAGPHNVRKYKGIPPFRETQSYVKRILKYYDEYLRANIGLPTSKS